MDKGLNTGDPGTMCSANTQPALRVPGGCGSGRESGGMAACTALPASKGTCASMDGDLWGRGCDQSPQVPRSLCTVVQFWASQSYTIGDLHPVVFQGQRSKKVTALSCPQFDAVRERT